MPKKFTGMNSKAVAAKARKDEKAETERARAEKAKEDALWAEDEDKGAKKKKDRKDNAEKKRQEAAEKKLERQRLLQEEEEANKASSGKAAGPGSASKVTRQEIQNRLAAQQAQQEKARKKAEEPQTHLSGELHENLNKVTLTENEATNIDEAIQVLADSGDPSSSGEKHPEKRMKAAYEAFEKERLPQLKAENSNLRLSQLKQMLRKEWMKHPSNPFNKNMQDYNTKK